MPHDFLHSPDPPLAASEQRQLAGVRRLLEAFVAEGTDDGGIDPAKSPWQSAGRGHAGADMVPRGVDVRYLRFLVEDLYRVAQLTGEGDWAQVADARVHFIAGCIRADHPTWALGNALEMIGVHHLFRGPDAALQGTAREVTEWLRERRVQITTADGVTFGHFPCGYGTPGNEDAGWTNDLSMAGSGLVLAYEVTGDHAMLDDAISFAEYFVQPWRPNALGADGYWHCGTWRDDLGSWVVGPDHYSGFESTDAYGDEVSWVFSTMTCTDYLTRLYRHHSDPRYLDRCLKALEWIFRECQFDDGAVGMCGRDDKWLGHTGNAISQVAMLAALLPEDRVASLRPAASRAWQYLIQGVSAARIEDHGVEFVTHQTSIDPLVNVGMLWASAVLGWLNGRAIGL